jgi:hypothetical protein
MAPQRDRAEPSSAQQRLKMTALDEPVAYNPRLDMRKPCRGKGTSRLLTMRSAKVGKVVSDEVKRRRQCCPGRAPDGTTTMLPRVAGERGKIQDLGLSLGWKDKAHMGCFQWR